MNREELMISELYDLQYTMAAPLFGKFRFPWEVLPEIGNFIMIGDEVEVGCGSVLNPGTVIGKHTNIYPLSSVRGCVPAFSIWKREGEIVLKA